MAGKKKKTELTEAQEATLTDEERQALEIPDEEGESLETKEEVKEEVKKEEVKEEEVVKKEVKEEVKVEEVKKEEVKAEEVKEEEVEIPDGAATILKDLNIPIQTKNGKHFIPFSELEKARRKAGEFKAENEALKSDIGTLRSRVEHLEKPKPEEKPPEEKPPEINLDEIEQKVYDGEITPKEGMELVKKAQATVKAEPEIEEAKPASAEDIAAKVKRELQFEAGLEKIYGEFPMLTEDKALDRKAMRFSDAIIAEALEGKTEEEQMAWVTNPENLINAARQAAQEVTDSVPAKESDNNFDVEAEREKITKEVTARLVGELNLKPDEVKTLSDVPSSSGPTSKKEELDGKSPEELEDALADMPKKNRDLYVNGKMD